MPRRRRSRSSFAVGVAIVIVFAIVAAALSVLALQSVEPLPATQTPEPAPTFTFGESDSSPTPSADPMTPVDRAEQRMLVFGSESGIVWRAIEGSCADDIDPLLERSADGGDTWTDVTPLYRDVRQILTLESYAGNQAQAVMVSGDECTVEGMRTFTQGEFWEPYAEVLGRSTYVSIDDGATLITPYGDMTAPCAEPRDVRTRAGAVSLICDGDLYRTEQGVWSRSGYRGVVAQGVENETGTAIVGWLSPDCDGVTVSNSTSAELTANACVSSDGTALGIALTNGQGIVWAGSTLTQVSIDE